MTPYMSYMLTSFIDLLKDFTKSTALPTILWISVVETLAKTFQVDEGGMSIYCVISFLTIKTFSSCAEK
jgi:BP28CT (NUC211) domain